MLHPYCLHLATSCLSAHYRHSAVGHAAIPPKYLFILSAQSLALPYNEEWTRTYCCFVGDYSIGDVLKQSFTLIFI